MIIIIIIVNMIIIIIIIIKRLMKMKAEMLRHPLPVNLFSVQRESCPTARG